MTLELVSFAHDKRRCGTHASDGSASLGLSRRRWEFLVTRFERLLWRHHGRSRAPAQGYDYNKNMEVSPGVFRSVVLGLKMVPSGPSPQLQGYPDEDVSGIERNYTCPAAYDACMSVTYSTTKRRQQLSVKHLPGLSSL